MFFKKTATLLLTVSLTAFLPVLSGCGPNAGGYDYNAHEVGRAAASYSATVVEVEQVVIHGNGNGQDIGALLGGVAGGLLGSQIGHGAGSVAAGVGGALLGAGVGAYAGKEANTKKGLQITVRYQDGNEETVVQGMKPAVRVGQTVRVIVGSDGSRRIQPK